MAESDPPKSDLEPGAVAGSAAEPECECESEECAVDDSTDVDDQFVLVQRAEKILAEQRLKHRNSSLLKLRETLPFHFSPLLLPLTISNFDACVALENAAFKPEWRCTPQKAGGNFVSVPSDSDRRRSITVP